MTVSSFNSFAQPISTYSNSQFAQSVISIDDFFERFNAKDGTGYKKYFTKSYGKFPTRPELILSLFNHHDINHLGIDRLDRFIKDVNAENCESFLNYSDKEWFAEVTCKIVYNNTPGILNLILKVDNSIHNSYCWLVVAANSSIFNLPNKEIDSLASQIKLPVISDNFMLNPSMFLSPVAHALEFSEIDKIFENNSKESFYFNNLNPSVEIKKLFILLQSKKIKFLHIQKIKYHLLQLKDWVVIVEKFNRNEMNSGWLISNIKNVTDLEKMNYKLEKLYLN